ncbi:MAG: NAD(P)-dependent oxidoreductase [Myxococcota bacterium]
MQLLVADPLDVAPLEALELMGVEVSYQPDLDEIGLVGAVPNVDVLVVTETAVPATVFEAALGLGLVIVAEAGHGAVDLDAASQRGVYVANCPKTRNHAVAELVIGMMVALDRELAAAHASLARGRWEHDRFARGKGLAGRTLGLAGLDGPASQVAVVAKALGMDVSVWSEKMSLVKAAALGVRPSPSLGQLFAESDVVSLHLPRKESTRTIVDATALARLREGAIFINTAHADLVDQSALFAAAKRRNLRLGLDALAGAPRVERLERFEADEFRLAGDAVHLCLTPRIAPSTVQARDAVAEEVSHIVRAFLTAEAVPNVVNVVRTTVARYVLVLRSLDRVGVLANVLAVVKRHGLNIAEIRNQNFEGGEAACTKLKVSGRPSDSCLQEIQAFEEVLHVDLVPLPNIA